MLVIIYRYHVTRPGRFLKIGVAEVYSVNGFAAIEGYTPQAATLSESLYELVFVWILVALAVFVIYIISPSGDVGPDGQIAPEVYEEMESLDA